MATPKGLGLTGAIEALLAARRVELPAPDGLAAYPRLPEPVLSLIEVQEYYFPGHGRRVTALAERLAQRLALRASPRFHLRVACLVHDLGKVGIPESILAKPAPLTAEERQIVERHPVLSAAVIGLIPGMDDIAAAVLYHHERWDGTGYPQGLCGEEIPLLARILCLADSYDAMTCERPYRRPLTAEEALAELAREVGTQFEPRLARLFLEIIQEDRQAAWQPLEVLQPVLIKR
jgi:HD-GYP domain-containing protein (c-di-GMP phosphodiesterase class II)